jgi:hypothetical protein
MDLNIINDLLKDYNWTKDITNCQHGKIYKITNIKTDVVYIGSTCQTLEERFKKHCCYYYKWHKLKTNKKKEYKGMTSYKVFKDGFSNITLIEDYPCSSIHELRKRKGVIILDYPTAVNRNVPGGMSNGRTNKINIDPDNVRSIPKPVGYKETSIQDLMTDLNMMP